MYQIFTGMTRKWHTVYAGISSLSRRTSYALDILITVDADGQPHICLMNIKVFAFIFSVVECIEMMHLYKNSFSFYRCLQMKLEDGILAIHDAMQRHRWFLIPVEY